MAGRGIFKNNAFLRNQDGRKSSRGLFSKAVSEFKTPANAFENNPLLLFLPVYVF